MMAAEADAIATRPLKRHVAAVVVGNALEFYDFLTYAFFAVYIGDAFFPSANPASRLLASLAAFGAGFITRPIGGIVIGSLGDRIGRKPAMFFSFSLMGVAMLGMVFTPAYSSIGLAAPILVILFRLLQGFALGGEVGPTTAFLVEAPPADMRGFYGSLQSASQYIAIIGAGLASTGLSLVLDPHALAVWGWRAVFLLGVLIIPFGLFVRTRLPETMHAADDAALAPDATRGGVAVPTLLRSHLRLVVCGLMMLAAATIATYVILFLATYAQTTLGITPQWSFAATLAIGICGAVCAPLGGALSDRLGRRPVMIVSALTVIAITVPAFLLLDRFRSGPVLVAVAAVLSVVFATGGAVVIMAITESLPARIRSGATATIYALSIAIFGGTTQFNIAWLTQHTGDAIAPAYYMTAAMLVGLAAMIAMPESAPIRLARKRAP
jgi:MFS transporter, MHS family, citrate/tricarballylate:H+ symporter